ncbi:MAG: hypothetical protein HYX32_14600 [Actinobacteria bacterium]|nr:hypothetical protein [Actinomycetota bacterium]
MTRCARCAREIDDTLARCPICGLDLHRPADEPTNLRELLGRLWVPYGDDWYPWQEEHERVGRRSPTVSPWGHGDSFGRVPAIAFAAVVVLGLLLSFWIIASVR